MIIVSDTLSALPTRVTGRAVHLWEDAAGKIKLTQMYAIPDSSA
jgi:hypothetical protein